MDRALKAFDPPGESDMSGAPHQNLQKRLPVLLSNSAKASGVPGPQKEADIRAWWIENREKIRLSDPWLETLEKQKID